VFWFAHAIPSRLLKGDSLVSASFENSILCNTAEIRRRTCVEDVTCHLRTNAKLEFLPAVDFESIHHVIRIQYVECEIEAAPRLLARATLSGLHLLLYYMVSGKRHIRFLSNKPGNIRVEKSAVVWTPFNQKLRSENIRLLPNPPLNHQN
jgi:hypothetical protein